MSSPSPLNINASRFASKISNRLSKNISTYNPGEIVTTWSDREKTIIDLLRLCLRHGLKPNLTNVLLPILGTEPSFWPVAKSISHQNTTNYLRKMRQSMPILQDNDKEMENAWIVTTLNESCLLEYFRILQVNKKLLAKYYKTKESLMANEEALNMIIDACNPLTKIVFKLRLEEYPDYLSERREKKELANISIHSMESSSSLVSSTLTASQEESVTPSPSPLPSLIHSASKEASQGENEKDTKPASSLMYPSSPLSSLEEKIEQSQSLSPLPITTPLVMRRRPSLLSQLLTGQDIKQDETKEIKEMEQESKIPIKEESPLMETTLQSSTAPISSIISSKKEDKEERMEESIPPPEIEKNLFGKFFSFSKKKSHENKKELKEQEQEQTESISILKEDEENQIEEEESKKELKEEKVSYQPKETRTIPLISALFGEKPVAFEPIKEEMETETETDAITKEESIKLESEMEMESKESIKEPIVKETPNRISSFLGKLFESGIEEEETKDKEEETKEASIQEEMEAEAETKEPIITEQQSIENEKKSGLFEGLFGSWKRETELKEIEEPETSLVEIKESEISLIEPEESNDQFANIFDKLADSLSKEMEMKRDSIPSPLTTEFAIKEEMKSEMEMEIPKEIETKESESEFISESNQKIGFFKGLFERLSSNEKEDQLREQEENQENVPSQLNDQEEMQKEEQEEDINENEMVSQETEIPPKASFFSKLFGGNDSQNLEIQKEGQEETVEPQAMVNESIKPQGYFGRFFKENTEYMNPSACMDVESESIITEREEREEKDGKEEEIDSKAKEDLLDIVQQMKNTKAPIQEIEHESLEENGEGEEGFHYSPLGEEDSFDDHEFYMLREEKVESVSSDLGILILPGRAFENIFNSLPIVQLVKWLWSKSDSSFLSITMEMNENDRGERKMTEIHRL